MNIFRSKMEDLSSAEVVRFRSKISLGKQIKFLFESQEFIFLRFFYRENFYNFGYSIKKSCSGMLLEDQWKSGTFQTVKLICKVKVCLLVEVYSCLHTVFIVQVLHCKLYIHISESQS